MAETKAQNRYRVIERIESGGMAEVFRGEAESLAGFKKQVAIKRVLPHLAQNEKFIRMFLDEARLCARLNHANIVQVFDIGHVENTYFIVMEFVDGVNLKGVVEFLRKRDQRVPLPAAVYIALQICNGLQYAHELADADGSPLNIVHRDMSPPNVLISKRGEIKIVDFGLAKAAKQVEKTDPGVVKGKFSYLAPETATGQEADAQADIFAVGIILWEMLAGRRLFLGDNDYATVKQVAEARVPLLRSLGLDVPPELDTVLQKSLARDKADRYLTAEALAQDLAQVLSSNQIAVTSFDIGKLVKEVIEEKRAQQKKEGKRDVSMIDKLIAEELGRFTSLGGDGLKIEEGANSAAGSKPLNIGEFESLGSFASDVLGDFNPEKLHSDSGDLASELEGEDPPSSSSSEEPSDAPPSPDTSARFGSAALRDSIPGGAKDAYRTQAENKVKAATIPPGQQTVEPEKKDPPKEEPKGTPTPAPGGGKSGMLAVVALLGLGAVAAALWFGGVIPH